MRPGWIACASSSAPISRSGAGASAYRWPLTVTSPDVGRVQAEDHPHRRGLAGAVGAEEAGDAAGLDGEVDAVDRGLVAVALGEVVGSDRHDRHAAAGADPPAHRGATLSGPRGRVSGAPWSGAYRRPPNSQSWTSASQSPSHGVSASRDGAWTHARVPAASPVSASARAPCTIRCAGARRSGRARAPGTGARRPDRRTPTWCGRAGWRTADPVRLEQSSALVGLVGHERARRLGRRQGDHVHAPEPRIGGDVEERSAGGHAVGEPVHVGPVPLVQVVAVQRSRPQARRGSAPGSR